MQIINICSATNVKHMQENQAANQSNGSLTPNFQSVKLVKKFGIESDFINNFVR